MNIIFIKTHLIKILVAPMFIGYWLMSTGSCSYAASWPLFRGTPQRTGVLIEQARPPLVPQWNFQIQTGFVSSPVVYKGILYCGGRDNNIWALNAYTGAQVWHCPTGGWTDATPCVTSSTVYVPCKDQNIYAINRLTGNVIWQTNTGTTDCSSPVLYGGNLYFLSGYPGTKLYCINASNGNMVKAINISNFGFSSPSVSVSDNLMFFGTNDGLFQCVDLQSGTLASGWAKPTQGNISFCSFAVDDNYVYAVSGGDEQRLYCFTHAGSQVWRSAQFNGNTAAVSSATLGQGKIFVASSFVNGTVTTLNLLSFDSLGTGAPDPTNVAPQWSTTIGQPHPSGIISSPSCADGTIYIGSGDGRLYCVDSSSGSYIEPGTGNLTATPTGYYLSFNGSVSTGIVSSPCVSNGWVYVNTYDGNMWGLQAQNALYISNPDNSDLVVNVATICGSTQGLGTSGFELDYAPGSSPTTWTHC